jgi:hypothetical protein
VAWEAESFSQRYLRYNQVTEREVLPRLSLGAEASYDPLSGKLDPVLEVHMDQLRTLHYEAEQIIDRSEALVQVVQAEAERLH